MTCRCPLRPLQAGVLLDPETEAQLGNEILEALEEDIVNELEIEVEVDIEESGGAEGGQLCSPCFIVAAILVTIAPC